jgi:hypothetical protein
MATIPEPYEDVKSLRASVMALKELVEELTGQRGVNRDSEAVTFADLPVINNGDAQWHPPPFVNGWADYGVPFAPCGFRKLSSGLVIMRGLCQGGTAATICTLPAGYRPAIRMLYVAETSPDTQCRLDLDPSGALTHSAGSSGWLSLSNICFLAEY